MSLSEEEVYFRNQLRGKAGGGKSSFEEIKPVIDEALAYLRGLNEFSTEKVEDALFMLANVPTEIIAPNVTALADIDFNEYTANRLVVGQYLLQHGFSELALDIVNSLLQTLLAEDIDIESKYQSQINFHRILHVFATYSDLYPLKNTEFCRSISTEKHVVALKQSLLYFNNHADDAPYTIQGIGVTPGVKTAILASLFDIISLCPDKRNMYRRNGIITILSEVDKSRLEMKAFSMMILSYVITDKQNESLIAKDGSIQLMTKLLIEAVQSDQHFVDSGDHGDGSREMMYYAYTARVLLNGLNRLAVNDANKLEIVKYGGLPAIIRMLQPDFSENERNLATQALWNLAFVDTIRSNSKIQGTTSVLKEFARSENKSVRDAGSYALWEISSNRERRSASDHPTDSPPSYGETLRQDSRTSHLMLSYQWDSQETVLAVRERLTSAGYKIWMDVDDISGDTLEAMAKAVETSSAVIMCITEKYKDSQSCRSEASYAMKLGKPIIPLLLEVDYKPDGWLGLILGTKLSFKFCTYDEVTTNIQKLIKEIEKQGLRCGGTSAKEDEADRVAGVVPEQAATQSTYPTQSPSKQPRSSDASKWSKEDVQSWLRENDLAELCSPLRSYRGKQLKSTYDDLCTSRQKLEETLEKQLGLSYITLKTFTTELEELFE